MRTVDPLRLLSHLQLSEIVSAVATFQPDTAPSHRCERRAAVAIVLRETPSGVETLFIRRAEHPLDPWSGHMAFPGGHCDPEDATLEAAARRETLEEVGLLLKPETLIGRLDDLDGGRIRPHGLSVSPFIYTVEGETILTLNSEIAEAVWIPLTALADPVNLGVYKYPPDPLNRDFPAIRYRDCTIWGMTYRMVENFLKLYGVEIPTDFPLTEIE